MSWYVQGKASEMEKLREDALQQNPDAEDQIDAVINCVKVIIESGSVGMSEGQDFLLTLQGHANPEHKKQPNTSADTVGVTVVQL